jgi:hypothetical protein
MALEEGSRLMPAEGSEENGTGELKGSGNADFGEASEDSAR